MRLGLGDAATPQAAVRHSQDVARAKGGWCVRVLAAHAGVDCPSTRELNDAEIESIEEACGFVTPGGNANGVVAAWHRGRCLPSPESVKRVLEATNGAVDLRAFLNHDLVPLLQLNAPPLDFLQRCIGCASMALKRIAGLDRLGGRMIIPSVFGRLEAQRLRDEGSLDAFVLLLALARHAELIDDLDAHLWPTRAARDLAPRVIAQTPWLQGNSRYFVHALHRVYWGRIYDGNLCAAPPLPEILENVKKALGSAQAGHTFLAGPTASKIGEAAHKLRLAYWEIYLLCNDPECPKEMAKLRTQLDEMIAQLRAMDRELKPGLE